jgi:putative Holliday junction resolvase
LGSTFTPGGLDMRILGIDYGDKNIGLAVSDELFMTARTVGTYRVKSKSEDKRYFENLIEEYKIGRIIIGLPIRMDGSEGRRAEKTRQFGDWLLSFLDIPIIYWDERLSTWEAQQHLRKKKIRPEDMKKEEDAVSAAIILTAYLEALK